MVRAGMAIILGVAIVCAILFMPVRGFDFLLFIVTVIGAFEFSKLFFSEKLQRYFTTGAITLSAYFAIFSSDDRVTLAVVSVSLFALAMVAMRVAKEMPNAAVSLAYGSLGLLYLGISFPCWSYVRHLDGGQHLVLLAIVPACLCDTFAYAAGKLVGRRKFAPMVSPNKTMEGYFGALVGALVGAFIVKYFFFASLSSFWIIGLSLVIWVVSPFGDLVESFLKRSIGVKDSGTLIPGHGGILDRLDALIFTAPAVFIYFKLAGF